MEGRFGDEDARRFELRQIAEGELKRKRQEFAGQLDEWLELTSEDTQHWGVREPAAGWFADRSDFIFCTTSRKMAWAQAAHLWSRPGYSKLWHVCCIEEWVDEQTES